MTTHQTDSITNSELVSKGVEALAEATDELEDIDESRGVAPEEVGSWIAVLGRALLAIIKP